MIRNFPILAVLVFTCVSSAPGSQPLVSSEPLAVPAQGRSTKHASGVTISTVTLPSAMVSVGYRTSLAASGGVSPYTWKVLTGDLPAGLVLDENFGIITGASVQPGTQTFEIQVEDAKGLKASRSFTLTTEMGNWTTTYYVDSVSGIDTNSGTSESAAWKTIAKVNKGSFAPGQRVLFRRGGVWREQLTIPSSGQPGLVIVFDAYGTGPDPVITGADLVPANAWTQCAGCQAGVWQAPVNTQPNLVLFNGSKGNKRGDILSLSQPLDWFWSSGNLYVSLAGNPGLSFVSPGVEVGVRALGIAMFGISNVVIQNLQISAANGLPTDGVVYAQASSSAGRSSHDLVFNHLTVTNGAADGIHLEDCNNCIVQGSSISGMARGGIVLVTSHSQYPIISGAMLGNTVANNHFDGISLFGCAVGGTCQKTVFPNGLFLSGLIISNNATHHNGAGIYLRWTNQSSVTKNASHNNADSSAGGEGYGVGVEASSNNFIAKNLLYANRTRGVELSNDSGAGTTLTGASNNTIEYNAIHDNGDHGLFTNAAPTQANRFLYNVVWNHPYGECFLANGVGHVFYGNVCWNNSTGVVLYTSSSTPITGNISIRNNIFAKILTRAVSIEGNVSISTLAFDYNDYDQDTATLFRWPGVTASMAGWRSLGFDIHSLVADPQFVSVTPTLANDFAVYSSSPAATSGVALGAPFTNGLSPTSFWPLSVTTISQGKVWSMGAFLQGP